MVEDLVARVAMLESELQKSKNTKSVLCGYWSFVGYVGNINKGLSGKIIIHDKVYKETNGASCSLDKSTGKFTSGKSGVYQISVSAEFGRTSDSSSFYVYLRTSSGNYQGSEAQLAYQQASGTSSLCAPLNAIRFISLQQGETAWLEYSCSDGLASHNCKYCLFICSFKIGNL